MHAIGIHCHYMHTDSTALSSRVRAVLLAFLLTVAGGTLLAQSPMADAPRVGLFDSVGYTLRRYWPDSAARRVVVEPLIDTYRERAMSARTFGDEVSVVRALLSKIPSSHLGVMSATSYRSLSRALDGIYEPMFGMHLMQWQGRWFAAEVLDSGPAHRAGIRPWDEVLTIDGVAPSLSARLDYRTDDAYLDDDHDPPVHPLIADPTSIGRFRIRLASGASSVLDLGAESYSAMDGTYASLRVLDLDGVRVGYVHLFYMHFGNTLSWLAERFDHEWANIDALLLDLRGRGGDGRLAYGIADLLSPHRTQRFRGPVVALQDRQTRSAKELLLDALRIRNVARLVGEPSAGAVLPSGSRPIGYGMMLMMPVAVPDVVQERLELHPIEPDVKVEWGGPLSGNFDPILDAGFREVRRLVSSMGRGVVLPKPAPLPPAPARIESKLKGIP
jgi:C-terminal processing protease CtpA/Prc